MDKEYERIKASGLTGDALLTVLTEFELKNMNHFSSKVDLGGYYLLTGNFQLAENFFLRAVEVEPKSPISMEIKQNISIMYGSLARIYLSRNDFSKAIDYVEKAIAAEEEQGKIYRFLKAHILIAQEKQEEALTLFYELYQSQREQMDNDDIQAFMYLLAKAQRFSDCAIMVDLYFEKGPFFQGLGVFASGAYEASGQPNKAVLAAFLDYEFYSGYIETNDSDFLANLNSLEKQQELMGMIHQTGPTLRLLRSLFDNSELNFERSYNAFFVEDYCYLKKKILTKTLSVNEFEQYLQLEHYFSRFPIYYWNIWQAALELSLTNTINLIPILEKIIILDRNGRYAQPAWEEITRIMGYARE